LSYSSQRKAPITRAERHVTRGYDTPRKGPNVLKVNGHGGPKTLLPRPKGQGAQSLSPAPKAKIFTQNLIRNFQREQGPKLDSNLPTGKGPPQLQLGTIPGCWVPDVITGTG